MSAVQPFHSLRGRLGLDLLHLFAGGGLAICATAAVGSWVAHATGLLPVWVAALAMVSAPFACAMQGGLAAHDFNSLGPASRQGCSLSTFWRGAIIASGGLLAAPWWFLHGRWRLFRAAEEAEMRSVPSPSTPSVVVPDPGAVAEPDPNPGAVAEPDPGAVAEPDPGAVAEPVLVREGPFRRVSQEDEATVIAPPRLPGSAESPGFRQPRRSRGRESVEIVCGPFRVAHSGQLAPTRHVRRRRREG